MQLLLSLLIFAALASSCKTLPQSGLRDVDAGDSTAFRDSHEQAENRLKTIELGVMNKMQIAIGDGAEPRVINALMAEWLSVKHQQDLLKAMQPDGPQNMELIKQLGLDSKAYAAVLDGVIDSDLGKLAEYRNLFVEDSARSNAFFDFLKLQGEAGRVLAEITKGKPLQNANTSNAELRDIHANKIRGAPGYLHDLPGLYFAVEDFNEGPHKGDRNYLKQRLQANLNHNGPDAGFWQFLKEKLVFSKAVEADAEKMLKGTMYDTKPGDAFAVENLGYADPVHPTGEWHQVYDRLSQATRGGHNKIYFEARVFSKPAQLLREFVTSGAQGTIAQLELCKSRIKNSILLAKASAAIESIRTYAAAMSQRNITADDKPADLTKVFAGDEFMRDLIANAEENPRFKPLVNYFTTNAEPLITGMDKAGIAVETEQLRGNPMGEKGADLDRIYGDDRVGADQRSVDEGLQRDFAFDVNKVTPTAEIKDLRAYDATFRVSSPQQAEMLRELERLTTEFERNQNPEVQKKIVDLQRVNSGFLSEISARSKAARVRR